MATSSSSILIDLFLIVIGMWILVLAVSSAFFACQSIYKILTKKFNKRNSSSILSSSVCRGKRKIRDYRILSGEMRPQQKSKESNKKMTAGQFADIVAEMRAAQKCYFRTRSQKSLEKSKELEKNVDDIIANREAMHEANELS